MSVGTIGFVPERLKQAREARLLTLVALADLVEVSSAAISHYEKGIHTPKPDTLRRLASALNVPVHFMLKDGLVRPDSNVFYRSMSAATKQARTRAERRYEWFKEIVAYLEEFFDFPAINLPEFDVPSNVLELTSVQIESMAEQVRDFWCLGHGPIANVTRTLESNGIFVSLSPLGCERLDAFSEFDSTGKPFVILGSDREVLVRTRFNAGHELFHILAHRNLDKSALKKPSEYKQLETQAHRFSAALLLPAKSFSDELWDVSLDSFRSMKSRWKVAVAAMIFRAEQLGLVDEAAAKRMRINLSRRGWRRHEPLDDLPVEKPTMISRAFELLVEQKVATPQQILDDLQLPAKDVEDLAGLESGFFRCLEDADGPTFKKPANVVSLRR